jgi:succinyl-CoA synthetase beta subunit
VRLVESIAKQVLARHGLQAPRGIACRTADEARAAADELAGDVFVKAQVPFGDRAGAGLVRRASGPDEAAAAAAAILGSEIEAALVESVLVEAAIDALASFYVSVHVDDDERARVLRVGSEGGAGYDRDAAELSIAVPRQGLELFEVRKLVGALGVSGTQRETLARAVASILAAARDWHAYTVEVNPLFLVADGALAIDAKVELDDYSLTTVPDASLLPEQVESERERRAREYQQSDHRGSFRYVQLIGDGDEGPRVGSHSVGGGESLVVFDALESVGLRPANYCDTSGAPSQEKVAFAAALIASQPGIDGYFFSSCIANQPLSVTANGLVEGFRRVDWRGPTVVRIAGNQEAEAREIVGAWAEAEGVRAQVVGRELDEWQAAQLLQELLG